MARPSKLTQEQCERIRMLKDEGITAQKLAKRFKISESSLYKILNGSYQAAPAGTSSSLPLPTKEDMGATPSLFSKPRGAEPNPQDRQIASRVIRAADASTQEPIDEVTLAAAELIVAQARYMQIRKHS
ncbi:helix-turn-helix domain-containing protein [Dyella sp. ASV21]|uniref:helix-turn-helix domain-containing protein n=1 Tax=Dyella sp. ASV21 TaxID=2795114 RepID=UPI0018EBB7B1|nr:helix-turn-helix domain-containing protein [Dyella sp. ASV21]